MHVTSEHVSTLRAYLQHDVPLFQQRRQQIDPSTRLGFSALLSCAFVEAVERHFAEDNGNAAIVEYVGDVRSRYNGFDELLDPTTTERVIAGVFTKDFLSDIDQKAQAETEFTLLWALIEDARLDEAGLDRYLEDARKFAEDALAGGASDG